jgi:pheromone shutdown-related protein TraB
MTEVEPQLPKTVHPISMDGRTIYLVGTAHVSRESVEDVRNTVEITKPDTICVELCAARHKAIVQRDTWKQMDIFKVIKEKKALFLLTQLIMASFYKKIGEKLGVQPGAEMIEGIQQAEKEHAELVLADRDIQITLKRVWGHLNCWNKLKMITQLVGGMIVTEDINDEMIEEMKNSDQLEIILKSFAESFPEVKKRLIDERDLYLAEKIRTAQGNKIVAVVGAGHVGGIKDHIHRETDLEPLTKVPPKSSFTPILKWGIPSLIIVLLIAGFFKGGAQHSIESIAIWVLVNGILSAAGAAIALAHPATIVSTFIGAPLTSLNPMIAAGWVAGLVQAWVKKPTVADLEEIPNAIGTVKGFWMNPVTRILLVVVLANMGSALGTFIAGSWIAARIF